MSSKVDLQKPTSPLKRTLQAVGASMRRLSFSSSSASKSSLTESPSYSARESSTELYSNSARNTSLSSSTSNATSCDQLTGQVSLPPVKPASGQASPHKARPIPGSKPAPLPSGVNLYSMASMEEYIQKDSSKLLEQFLVSSPLAGGSKTFELVHSLLTLTCVHGATACLNSLISFVKVNPSIARPRDDTKIPQITSTPLYVASRSNHAHLLPALIRHRALFKRFYSSATEEERDSVTVSGVASHSLYHMEAVSDEITALHVAARANATRVISALVKEYNYDVSRRTDSGETPLHFAACDGRAEATQILLELGADLSLCDVDGATPLYFAAEGGHVDVVKVLLSWGKADQRRSLNSKTVQGYSALHASTLSGSIETTQVLIDTGINVNSRTLSGDTPLLVACRSNKTLGVFMCLLDVIEKRARSTSNEDDGWSHVRETLDKVINGGRRRAIDIACGNGATKVVEKLIELGCDCGPYRYNSSRVARRGSSTGRISTEPQMRRKTEGGVPSATLIAETLGSINDENDCIKTSPLTRAAEKGHLSIVRMLLASRRVNIDEMSGDTGGTAMMAAVTKVQPRVVKYLLRCGSNLRTKDARGFSLQGDIQTFLPGKPGKGLDDDAAALRKNRGKVKKLLTYSKSAWSDQVEKNSWTAWGIAVANLVLNGVPEVERGWGLGEQGIDMRREIMKFLRRDDFVARRRVTGGCEGWQVKGDLGWLTEGDYWFSRVPSFQSDDDEGGVSSDGSDGEGKETKGSNFRVPMYNVPAVFTGFERGSAIM